MIKKEILVNENLKEIFNEKNDEDSEKLILNAAFSKRLNLKKATKMKIQK
jgi:hypothetical protein